MKSYIGISPCGCVQAATVDDPAHSKDVRRNVSSFLRWGHVERVSNEEVRRRFCTTPHKKGICPHPQSCPDSAPGKESL